MARGQSYRDVARETGVLISTLHKVEHGGDPRLSTVQALLPWLGVAPSAQEWADYFEHWTQAVGPEPLTVDLVIKALRLPSPPFGVAKGATP